MAKGKFIYFNDTNRIVSIHPATIHHGCEVDLSAIQPQTIREFTLPEGAYAWVKMWDYKTNLQILVTPHNIWDDGPAKHDN